jgi:hypothetical protein
MKAESNFLQQILKFPFSPHIVSHYIFCYSSSIVAFHQNLLIIYFIQCYKKNCYNIFL